MAETRKFPHHLIREIFEQPDALRRTIEPRVSLAERPVQSGEGGGRWNKSGLSSLIG